MASLNDSEVRKLLSEPDYAVVSTFNPDGSINTNGSPAGNNVPNLAQMVVLNYMALHGTSNAISMWPNLYGPPNLVNSLGSGAATLEPLPVHSP